MRIFIDTEFIEKRNYLELISIALVTEEGDKYYAILDYDKTQVTPWLDKNVIPKLSVGECAELCPVTKTKEVVAQEIIDFVARHTDEPRFMGYFCDYDWVIFCWLFGTMMELPKNFPMYCWDLKQFLDDNNVPKEIQPENPYEHNALYDAMVELLYLQAAEEWLSSQDDTFSVFLSG